MDLKIVENQLRGKTFSLYGESQKDTLSIEFQDSTYQVFGAIWEGKIPWRIAQYGNMNFLVLNNKVSGIKKTNEDTYICTYIGLSDNIFTMVERKSKWNQELLYGVWVKKENEKHFDYSLNDNVQKPPPPPSLQRLSENKYQWPPFYEITKDSIKFHKHYSIGKSTYEINNTKEYLLMELGNEYGNGKNWEWNVKDLSENIMIVEKKITKLSSTKFETDTLIRKYKTKLKN